MKTINLLFLLLGLVLITFSCSEDELDADKLTDLPPGILSVSPSDKGQVVLGNFDITVVFADGENSPLASATLTLSDEFGNMLGSKTDGLSGTRDSITLEGSEFNAELLGPGGYQIDILASDVSGNEVERKTTFDISLQEYPANNAEMYIAGPFNNWGSDAMMLVAPYTWEIEVDLQGDEWKLKNTEDWQMDWGDPDCDGFVEETTGGGPNTPAGCAPSGVVRFSFNDQTLAYTISPLVEFATNISGLYLLGTFNEFQGAEFKFNLVADNTWELPEVLLMAGDKFKFSEGPNFMGRNWGDAEGDGVAEEFGGNIEFSGENGYYKVAFNDKTLEYSFEFVRGLGMSELYLVGGLAAHGAWTPADAIPFKKVEDNVFEIYAPLEAGTGFKFLEQMEFTGDWGIDPDNPGNIIQEGEVDAMVDETGFYRIRVDFNDNTATFTKTDWGIIGDATPGGWDSDTDMTFQNDFEWTITLDLIEGLIKFRANDNWDINFGDNDPIDGILDFGGIGNDIPISEDGNYTVTMKFYPEEDYSYEVIKN